MQKQHRIVILACFILLIFVQWSIGQSDPTPSLENSSRHVLDNGMTVLIHEMPASPSVSLYAFVKTGSATEGEFLGTGISHFLEHMLFKGTQKRKVGEIAKEVHALGGWINASTSFDYTIYTIDVPAETFNQALDIIADMLMNSVFDEEQIKKELEVVFGEIRLYKDRPDRKLSELVYSSIYKRHPYQHPIIGYEPLLKDLTREDFLKYYKIHYIPNNIVFSVAGNVKTEEALSNIKDVFSNFKQMPYPMRNLPEEPQQVSMRRMEQVYPTDVTRLSVAFPSVRVLNSDVYALDVLAKILGDGESARLYLELYKKLGLVKSVSVSNYTPMDKGMFEVECLLDDVSKIDQTIEAIMAQIKLIEEKGIPQKELDKVKKQVLTEYIFGRQRSGNVAYDMAVEEAFTGDYQFARKYVQQIRSITAEDIKRVAQIYFKPQLQNIVVLKPFLEGNQTPSREENQALHEIQKKIFENGLTLLVREDHTFPIVSVRVLLNGGTKEEPLELNGLSELTARLWTSGTKKFSAYKIAELAESEGINVSGFSGRNSFGLTMGALAEDFDMGLDLLEDLIKNPIFPEEELKKEKELVKTAIITLRDDISAVTGKELRELLFLKNPFRLQTLGTLESVERITREDILNFYKKFTVASNMVITVYGDIDPQDIEEIIKEKFSGLAKGALQLSSYFEEPPNQIRKKDVYLDKKQAMVMIGFQAPTISSPDRYGFEMLSSVLGSPLRGRLFTKIRDELGQSYTLGANYGPGIDAGFIYFYTLTTEDQVETIKNILLNEITRLQHEIVPRDEFEDTKAHLKGIFKMSLETNAALSSVTGFDELYGLGFNRYKSYTDSIDKVSQEDLMRMAKEYLDVSKAAIVITRPKQE